MNVCLLIGVGWSCSPVCSLECTFTVKLGGGSKLKTCRVRQSDYDGRCEVRWRWSSELRQSLINDNLRNLGDHNLRWEWNDIIYKVRWRWSHHDRVVQEPHQCQCGRPSTHCIQLRHQWWYLGLVGWIILFKLHYQIVLLIDIHPRITRSPFQSQACQNTCILSHLTN